MLEQSHPPGSTYPTIAPRAADAEPDVGSQASEQAAGTLPGSTSPSWLIAPQLRLQPLFFPTCTGAGTSVAAMRSYCQQRGHPPSVVFLRGREQNCSHRSVGSPRYVCGLRGLEEKHLEGDFRDSGNEKDQPEGRNKFKPGG